MQALDIICSLLLAVVYVWLEWHERKAVWFLGIVISGAYFVIFFKGGLYANAAIQAYYILASIYGILLWSGVVKNRKNPGATTQIKSLSRRGWLSYIVASAVLVASVTLLLSLLPGENGHPFLDGLTSSLSMVGMWMLAKKYYQQWYVWMVVNPVTVLMCLLSQMYVVAAFYAVSFVMSIMGYRSWLKKYRSNVTAL